MNRCIPRSESAYNTGITTNNPTPSAPVDNDAEYKW